MIELNSALKHKLLSRVVNLVAEKHFDPNAGGLVWQDIVQRRREKIMSARDGQEFETEVNDLLKQLKTSHTAFVHQSSRKVPSRTAINATFQRYAKNGAPAWMFQDVHPGGPAVLAGMR